jgi:hypothetical protein
MSQTYSQSPPPTRRVFILLTLVVWVAMTLVALGFVLVFGSNAPYADEWEFVPALLGKDPLSSWLWTQHNEHRLPLSRAIYYTLFQITHDFRTGMFLQVAMLSVLALGLMRLAAHLRGRSDWVDVFFPVALLHVGHWENFVMGYQLCFALFCCLVSGLAVVALQTRRETAFRSGALAGVLLLLIALTGGFGLAVVPPVAAWLVYLAVLVWQSGTKIRALMLLALAALPVVYMAMYFNGYERPSHHEPPSRDPVAIGIVTGEVLAMALGIGVRGVWWLVAIVELAIGAATVILLIRQGRNPTNRPASAGLIAVAAGVCGLALAIGIGRGSMGLEMGLWSRYSLLSWPLLGAAYLVWVKAGRKWLPIVFCVAAALAFPTNMYTGGMLNGPGIRKHYNQIESDARLGISAEQIVQKRFPNSVNGGQEDRAIQGIPLLRSAGIGVFGAGNR